MQTHGGTSRFCSYCRIMTWHKIQEGNGFTIYICIHQASHLLGRGRTIPLLMTGLLPEVIKNETSPQGAD